MEFRVQGKTFHFSFWKTLALFLVLLIIALLFWFGARVRFYYSVIKNGQANPLLDQRLESSYSRLVANANVTPDDLKRILSADAPVKGPANAKLTVVEFIDFDCPYSRRSFPSVRELMEQYQDRVRFVIRDFPIEDIHPRASAEAKAARCANEQGKYWAYHDKLFGAPDRREDADLRRFADEAGLNGEAFAICVASDKYDRVVKNDLADGLKSGVEGTPTFFFNGIKVQGALDRETLEFLIKKFLSS